MSYSKYSPLLGVLLTLCSPGAVGSTEPPTQLRKSGEGEAVPFAREVEKEERIFRVLDESAEVHALDAPFPDVVGKLAFEHDIPIVFDRQALRKAQIEFEFPLVLALKGVTLRNALDRMLTPKGMSYLIRDGVLYITSLDEATKYEYVRVYKLPSFCVGKEEKVIEVLTKTVSPTQWSRNGGDFSVVAIDGRLTISANLHVHDASQKLLAKLRRASDQQRQ